MKNHYNWKLIFSLGLFAFIIVMLGIPYTNWWFNGCDDFHGLYLGFRTKTWSQLFYFFCDGHINQDIGPSNYVDPAINTTFFSTYYRPLYCVYLTLQYWIFGTNAYAYFLCNVFFHAINTVLLFNIFLYISSFAPALLGALFFAFHPQVGYRFGAIVNLHYYINVMLILMTIIALVKYLDSNKLRFYLFAYLAFTVALFTRESSIVLPIILLLGLWSHRPSTPFSLPVLGRHLGMGGITSSFLAFRMYLYPLPTPSASTLSLPSLLPCLVSKSQELLVLLYDCFGLSWLPWGQRLLRGGVLAVLLILFAWLFMNNRKKLSIMLCMLSATLMLWPALIGCYSPRYIYEALPFVIGAFIFCFIGFTRRFIQLKKPALVIIGTLVGFNMFFTIECFLRREQKMHTISRAVQELVANPITQNRALCLLSFPMDGLGDQPTDIIRVLRQDTITPVYCDTASALVQNDSNIVTTTRWKNIVSAHYTKNYVTITPVDGGFRFKSSDPTKINFFIDPNSSYSIGKKIINHKETLASGEVITDFTLLIDKQYLDKNPVFVVWNYEKPGFEVIAKSLIT